MTARHTLARLRWLVVLVVATAAPRAHASSFAQFVADLRADPGRAAGYLSTCDTLVTPSGEVRRPCALAAADLGVPADATLVVTRARQADFTHADAAFLDAIVEARVGKRAVARFRVFQLEREVMLPGDHVEARPQLVHWTRIVPDAELRARVTAGTLTAPPAVRGAVTPVGALAGTDVDDWAALAEDIAADLAAGQDLRAFTATALDGDAFLVRATDPRPQQGRRGARAVRAWRAPIVAAGPVAIGGTPMAAWGIVQGHAPLSGTDRDVTYTLVVVYTTRQSYGGGSLIHDVRAISIGVAG